MDPMELESMLNSDDKDERIRARRMRIAARIAAREREAVAIEAETAASESAGRETVGGDAVGDPPNRGRPDCAVADGKLVKPAPVMTVARSKKTNPANAAQFKSGVDDAVGEARRVVDTLNVTATRDVLGVSSELDAREYRRRADDRARRVLLSEKIKEEADASQVLTLSINEGWNDIAGFAKHEPLALRDFLEEQRRMCEAQISQKNEAATLARREGEKLETSYVESLVRQKADIDTLLRKMHVRYHEHTRVTKQSLEDLETELETRRSVLLEKNKKEMVSIFDKRETAEREFCDKTLVDARKYAFELDKRRADDAEEFAILKTRLETDVANLEQHLGEMRAVYQLNAEKLEYNYRVLVEREAENQSTSSSQRKKIAAAREKLMVLKQKCHEQELKFESENVKLADEHRRAVGTFNELQMKHKRFVKGDTTKFHEVWRMHEDLVAAKVKRVLDADRVIHEQQLGWRWRPPSDDVFLKPDDLALLEGRKKRLAAAAAAAAANAESLGSDFEDEDEEDEGDDPPTPMGNTPAGVSPSQPSIAESEENPFSKRLGDPAYAELLQVTTEACGYLVDPVTKRTVDEATLRAAEAGDADDTAATAAACHRLVVESVLKAIGVRDAPSFDSFVNAMTTELPTETDDDDETERETRNRRTHTKLRRTNSFRDVPAVSVPDTSKITQRLAAFAESEKGASASGRALAALKAANAAVETEGGTGAGSDSRKDLTQPRPRKTRAQLESAFWQRQADAVGAKPTRAWFALERGLRGYLRSLKKRKETLETAFSLQKQNDELRGLLRQYLGADINDELLVPPSALI